MSTLATSSGTGTIDRSALKVNQTGIVVTLLTAFFASPFWPGAVWLVPLLALVLLAGTFEPRAALFKQLYLVVLRPRKLVRPRPAVESPRPHNFAQLLGGIVLALSSITFAAGTPLVGWILAWIVVVLAAVNLVFGFCLGCQIFYRLERYRLVTGS